MRYLGGAALLFAVFLGVSIWQLIVSPRAAQTLPDLSLTALNGRTEQLEKTHNTPTVVYLWTTDCGACEGEFELLADAARSARYGSFRYLFVNQGNSEAAVRRYLDSNGLSGVVTNVYLDPTNSAYDAFGAGSLPVSYFFRADGAFVGTQAVIARPDRLEYTLEPLLK